VYRASSPDLAGLWLSLQRELEKEPNAAKDHKERKKEEKSLSR